MDDLETSLAVALEPGRISFGKSTHRIEALDELERRISGLAEGISLKMQMLKLELKHDSGLKEVDLCDITHQSPLFEDRTDRQWCKFQQKLVPRAVRTFKRMGRVGKMPVLYKTYSAASAMEFERVSLSGITSWTVTSRVANTLLR
ncbi:hypothetical protein FRC07_003052 [Ceratobasidium sp. 392]|nr:hypothetical protein FRC07_003052 [Ceratobasidium sp. 392]